MKQLQRPLARLFSKVLESPPPSNETEVEYRVLGPVLETLGWDSHTQIDWRYQVGDTPRTGIVDVSLHSGDNIPRILLEAKSWDSNLTRHIEQVMRYAFHEAANICVLTNGREWQFYLPRAEGDVRDRMFASADIQEDGPTSAAGVIASFLAAEQVLSGAADAEAEEALAAFKSRKLAAEILPTVWERMRSEPDKALLRLLSKNVEKETGSVPHKKDLVEVIQSAHPPIR